MRQSKKSPKNPKNLKQRVNIESQVNPENPNGSNSGIQISDEKQEYLRNLYYNTESPVAFSSLQKIFDFIKQNHNSETPKIKRRELEIWLSKQEAFTSHKGVRRKFKRPKVIAFTKNYQWDTDTANMQKYEKYNDGYGYFVVFIDIFTRYLYTATLKTLTGLEMSRVMRDLFEQTDTKPKILRSDQGSEFKNNQVKNLLLEKGVKHIFTYFKTKANYAERFIKTLKLKIRKYLTSEESFRWIDALYDLTSGYNNAIHSSIDMSPEKARSSRSYRVWYNQYGKDYLGEDKMTEQDKKNIKKLGKKSQIKKFRYKVGDKVKISFLKKTFDREYSERWSGEIFTVTDRKMNQAIPMYKLKDYNNDLIEGYFYEAELQLAYIGQDVLYKIEKIIQKRNRNKINEVLVKWKGWPAKFNSWIPESEVQRL